MKVLGINELGDSSVVYRVTMEVSSMKHYSVERYLRKEIKNLRENIMQGMFLPLRKKMISNGL